MIGEKEEVMDNTKRYRDKHDELLKIATEISSHLNVDEISNSANEVRSLLSQLLGKLNVHLAMEDKSLYPRLLDHSDERVKSTAKKFIDEMGDVGKIVNSYNDKWSNASKIEKDPNAFIEQTKGIFDAFGIIFLVCQNFAYNVPLGTKYL